jgi:hypothetical protein
MALCGAGGRAGRVAGSGGKQRLSRWRLAPDLRTGVTAAFLRTWANSSFLKPAGILPYHQLPVLPFFHLGFLSSLPCLYVAGNVSVCISSCCFVSCVFSACVMREERAGNIAFCPAAFLLFIGAGVVCYPYCY